VNYRTVEFVVTRRATVTDARLTHDPGASCPSLFTMGVHVVDVDHHVLRVRAAHVSRRTPPRKLFLLGAHHDQAFTVHELRVLDTAVLAENLLPHLEAKSAA
jgi:hypothetical protein